MTCCGPQQLRLHTTNALQFLQSHFTTSFFSILSFFYSTYAGYCGNTNWAEKMSLIFSPYNFWVSRFLKCRNSTLFPKLFWPNVRKKSFIDRELFLKFKAEGQEFAQFLSSVEQFIRTVKENAFLTCSWRFLKSNKLQWLEFKLEKIIEI